MNIFLLEDDPRVAESLSDALEDRGHAVHHANSIAAAEELLVVSPFKFDLGILDFQVPGGNGVDLLPLPFPCAMYSGVPEWAIETMEKRGIEGVPAFSKIDPFVLLEWVENQ